MPDDHTALDPRQAALAAAMTFVVVLLAHGAQVDWKSATILAIQSAALAGAIAMALGVRGLSTGRATAWALALVMTTELFAATRVLDHRIGAAAAVTLVFEAMFSLGIVRAMPILVVALGAIGWFVPATSHDAWATGIYGLVLSTGNGLLWFAPILWLSAHAMIARMRQGRDARLRAGWALAIAGLWLVVQGARTDWHGGEAFGPIRMVPVLPLVLVEIVAWVERVETRRAVRVLAMTLTLAGGVVQALGAVVDPAAYLRIADQVKNETGAAKWFSPERHQVHFVPQFSPIIGHAWLVRMLILHRVDEDLPFDLVVPTRPKLSFESLKLRWNWWGASAK